MIDFAIGWLADLYGADIKKRGQAQPCDALEQRAVGARRVLGGGARRPAVRARS